MSLNQEAIKVATEAHGMAQTVQEQSSSVYSEIVGGAAKISNGGFHLFGPGGATFTGGVNTVGINENEIPVMKNAVNDYIDRLNQHLDQVKIEADTSQAFKGDYSVAVKEFVNAVCTSCRFIISNLRAFNDDLDKVLAAYKEKDTQMASELNSTAGGVESAFTEYNSGN